MNAGAALGSAASIGLELEGVSTGINDCQSGFISDCDKDAFLVWALFPGANLKKKRLSGCW